MADLPTSDSGASFLSYSRADEDFAVRLASDLRDRGVTMWIDRHDIRPSEHWDRAIERAIRGCRNLVVILSPRSVASDNVADEISLAIDSGKPVIPIMIERCSLPLRITRMHLIDATRGYESALQQCLSEIRSEPGAAESAIEDDCTFDPDFLAAAREQLARIIGPIAGMLVDRGATRAQSVAGLTDLLALHVADDADRELFVAALGQEFGTKVAANPGAIARSIRPKDVEKLAKILASYVGPIAFLVARKEWRVARSLKDLRGRLAARLDCERDRSDFLRLADVR